MLNCSDGLTLQCQCHYFRVKVKISSAFELSTYLEFYDRCVFIVYSSELSRLYGINENATQLPASGDQGQDKCQSS